MPSVTVTIPAGEAVSAPVNLPAPATMLAAPVAWTPAPISFQVSVDGSCFADLFDEAGEVVRPLVAGAAVTLDPRWTRDFAAVRVRSGTRDGPVPQAADRVVTLACGG
jgi:hypothetical protein